jgi:ABC-2 type transport system ATP-binding protein
MSRDAKLYLLDEPIAGVDPAARDYVIKTIMNNYSPKSTIIISTHLISDVEQILSDFVFIHNGQIVMEGNVDEIRNKAYGTLEDDIETTLFGKNHLMFLVTILIYKTVNGLLQ